MLNLRWLIFVQVVALLIWPILHGHFDTATDVDYDLYDGTFQSYNAASRMRDGQYPFRDFACYLGIGPTYVDRLASFTGPTYGDWDRGRIVIRLWLYCAAIVLMSRLSGLPTPVALAMPMFIYAVDACSSRLPNVFNIGKVLRALKHFNVNDYSALGVRSLAPCLFAFGLIVGRRFFQRIESNRRLPVWRGMLAGLCLAWSNDYGIPTFIAVVAAYIAFAPYGEIGKLRVVLEVLLLGMTALVVAIGVIWMATGGDLAAWYDFNFRQVAPNQKWYFIYSNLYREGRSAICLSLGDLPWRTLIAPVFLVGWGVFLRRFQSDREKQAGELAMMIVIAAYGAALLTAIGGYWSIRYLVPFIVYASILAVGFAAVSWRMSRFAEMGLGGNLPRQIAFGVAIVGLMLAAGNVRATHSKFQQSLSNCYINVPELGGRLSEPYSRVVAVGRELRRRCDSEQVPPSRRLCSAYTTALDIIVGAKQPSTCDYLIHAMSPRLIAEYVERFQVTKPKYAAVPPAGKRWAWENWLRNAAWPFYSELIRHYEPLALTQEAVIWARLEKPREPLQGKVSWKRVESNDTRTRFAVALESRDSEAAIVEISARYRMSWRESPVLHGCFAKLAVVEVHDADHQTAYFAIDPQSTQTQFTMVLVPGIASFVEFQAWPAEAARLEIELTRADLIAHEYFLQGLPLRWFCLSPCHSAESERGILIDGRTGFRLTDKVEIGSLKIGDALIFAESGKRLVTALEHDIVLVDGASLNPAKDGFPNLVRRPE